MSDDMYDEQILSEKLSKLNSSQQCIESLSKWCIAYRKKAKHIVETWDKVFKSAQREQRVSFLYLANDILQNSRRKGSEFVNEFWKVLPAAVKHVYENGDEHGKKAASRLVDIWEERKVFGSRGQNLKDEMLGKNAPPVLVSNGKNSNPIKVVKRDAHSLRIKLAIGGMPERIITAFQLVHDGTVNEETALNKTKGAIQCVGEMEKDVENISTHVLPGSALINEIQEQENVLQHCISQLESAQATRVSLVCQLKDALQDQESKLELIRSGLHVCRGQLEQAKSMRQRLMSPSTTNVSMEATRAAEFSPPSVQLTSGPLPGQPMISFSASRNIEEDNKKAAAAAVAAKLTASTSSAQMLTSVLSSLVAEEAASLSGGLKSSGFTSGLPSFSPEKRPKLDKLLSVSDGTNSEVGKLSFFTSLQQQSITNVPVAPPPSMPPISQANQMQSSFPPPPPISPPNSNTSQLVHSAGLMMGGMPYGYGAGSLPPPPPLPSHIAMGLPRPSPQTPQHQQSQQLQPQSQAQQQPQQPANGVCYRPSGIGFYGQSHQPATPTVPRQ